MGVSLMRIKKDWKARSWRSGGLLVLSAAAVTVVLLDVAQEMQQHFPLHNFYNSPPYRVSQYDSSPNDTSTHADESSDVPQSFCDGKYCKEIGSNDKEIGGLKDYDDVEGRNDVDFLLPTRPRAKNLKLYQKEFVQHLSNNWVRGAHSTVLKDAVCLSI